MNALLPHELAAGRALLDAYDRHAPALEIVRLELALDEVCGSYERGARCLSYLNRQDRILGHPAPLGLDDHAPGVGEPSDPGTSPAPSPGAS